RRRSRPCRRKTDQSWWSPCHPSRTSGRVAPPRAGIGPPAPPGAGGRRGGGSRGGAAGRAVPARERHRELSVGHMEAFSFVGGGLRSGGEDNVLGAQTERLGDAGCLSRQRVRRRLPGRPVRQGGAALPTGRSVGLPGSRKG